MKKVFFSFWIEAGFSSRISNMALSVEKWNDTEYDISEAERRITNLIRKDPSDPNHDLRSELSDVRIIFWKELSA